MFILDTNVLSATMGRTPDTRVGEWIIARPLDLLFTTAICQAEILAGLAIMPEGRRRRAFESAARAMFLDDFEGRVLPFDSDATTAYAELFAARRHSGRPIAIPDLMIAAIARAQGASVVTRDISGFEGCGLMLINPWNAA